MAISAQPKRASGPSYGWASPGDVNAFFGLMLDNVGCMILMASLLVKVYGFPYTFVLTRMIPGTAVGVLVGDLIYTFMAFQLARRTGRSDVTAMPLGLDTPSTFGTVFLIMGPAFRDATGRLGMTAQAAAQHAWFLGIAMLLASGLFKLAAALVSGPIRRLVPRAGLLGSLTAIALVLISFLPLLDIVAHPVVGLVALAIILATLTARWELPGRVPGALAAVVVGSAVYYGMHLTGLGPGLGHESAAKLPAGGLQALLPMPIAPWLAWFAAWWQDAAAYLPVAIPLALATVVGGIDCAESAAAAGDDYPTGPVIAAEAVATLAGALFGGVIQSTPYIGHPAYKAMGARSGYTLAAALFVGSAGVLGYFEWIFYVVPKPVIFPILIFVGLEITAQSFRATPMRHYPAVGLACVPALASLAALVADRLLEGHSFQAYPPEVQNWLQVLTVLSGGFILTSLLWGTALARLIDGRMRAAAATFALAGLLALFGFIHSPLRSTPILLPWQALEQLKRAGRLEASALLTPYHWAAAYLAMAGVLLAIGQFGKPPDQEDSLPPDPQ